MMGMEMISKGSERGMIRSYTPNHVAVIFESDASKYDSRTPRVAVAPQGHVFL
jgi:hypothetical protein